MRVEPPKTNMADRVDGDAFVFAAAFFMFVITIEN